MLDIILISVRNFAERDSFSLTRKAKFTMITYYYSINLWFFSIKVERNVFTLTITLIQSHGIIPLWLKICFLRNPNYKHCSSTHIFNKPNYFSKKKNNIRLHFQKIKTNEFLISKSSTVWNISLNLWLKSLSLTPVLPYLQLGWEI